MPLAAATRNVDKCSLTLYTFGMVIRNFRHKGLERLFAEDDVRGILSALAPKLKRMLFALANAAAVSDMALFPGWRLASAHRGAAWVLEPHRDRQLAPYLPL